MKIIPRNLIQHLEWQPGQEPSTPPAPEQLNPVSITSQYSVDDIINNGQEFYDNKLPIALQQAIDHAGTDGIVVTMPELLAAKIQVERSHQFWNNWFSVQTEENIGIDESGTILLSGESALVVVHGGGILTPERIEQAYTENLINGSAKYTNLEFADLLQGKLPDGSSIQLYTLDDIKRSSPTERRYGIVMPFSIAQETESKYHQKDEFVENPLVVARFGGMDNIEKYFDLAKDSDQEVGNWHRFTEIDPTQAQGRVLYLNVNDNGLSGNGNLDINGRFVGVAPEVPSR
jgi:hypothetical protein